MKKNNKRPNYNKGFAKTKEIVDYFPRNNDKSDFTYNLSSIDYKKGGYDEQPFLNRKRKQPKEKRQQRAIDEDDGEIVAETGEQGESTSRVLLPRFKTGDLVLLAISEIRKDYMIANYSRNKKAMIHSSYSGLEHVEGISFDKYFTVGQFICGAVVSPGNDIQLPQGHLNKKILVSIDPKIINTGLRHEDLTAGMDVWGQLEKDKDGYTADFRIKDFEEQLAEFNKKVGKSRYEFDEDDEEVEYDEGDNEDDEEEASEDFNIERYKHKPKAVKAETSNNDYEIILIDNDESPEIFKDKKVGSYYHFKVIKVDNKKEKLTITVSLNHSKYKFPINVKSLNFKALRPGFLFKANETRDLMNGIEVAFCGNIGSIFQDHKVKKDKNIPCRIIHLSMNKQAISLSSNKNIIGLKNNDIEDKLATVGQIYENVKVEEALYGGSYTLSVSEEQKAFLHKSHTEDEMKKHDANDVIEKVCVKEYNFFDDKPIVTTRKDFLDHSLTTWDNIQPGLLVNGSVKEIKSDSIIVKLNDYITGKIPKEHLSDYPLSKIPKKFKNGQSIKCRVFAFDRSTKNLILTIKESLMDENVLLTGDIDKIREGEEIYVTYVGNKLFHHAGKLLAKLLNFKALDKKENFKIGKLYSYKVYKINAYSNKIFLTNEEVVWQPGVGDYRNIIRRNPILLTIASALNTELPEEIGAGAINSFDIIPPKKLVKILLKKEVEGSFIQENLDLITKHYMIAKLEGSRCYSFIPVELLSDYYQTKFLQIYTKAQVKKDLLVLYTDNDSKVVFLTGKNSLIQNKDHILLDQPQKNSLYYGFINKKINANSIQLQFLGDNNKALIKSKANLDMFNLGQTVVTKCLSAEKRKLFDILNIYKDYTADKFQEEAGQYINNYVNELSFILENDTSIGGLFKNIKIGSVIEGKVAMIKDYGVLITLSGVPQNVTGFLRNEHIVKNKEYKVGESKVFTIIDSDVLNGIVYLTESQEENTDLLTTSQFFNDSKGESYSFVIEIFHDNYISAAYEGNRNIKAILPCNLYNFQYESSDLHDLFKIGDVISSKVVSYDDYLNKVIIEFPNKLISKLKSSKEKGSKVVAVGNVVNVRINGIKGTHVYVYINKTSIGKIHFNDFVGNIDELKAKLKDLDKITLDKDDTLKIKCKVLHIEKKDERTVVDLTNNVEGISGHKQLSKELDLSGKVENIGIISRLDFNNKCPVKIDNQNPSYKITIPFYNIPFDVISSNELKNGSYINFYSRNGAEGTLEHSLIPFNKISNDISIGKVYPVRIVKAIDGRGLIVDINDSHEGFVDVCEVSDDLHANPLEFYKKGHVLIARVISYDEKLNKYFLSLRHSITDESSYNVLTTGATIKFNKQFDQFEKIADYRNKILKFGAEQVISNNLVAIGYITSSSEKGVFIKLSTDVIVRAPLKELTDEKTVKPFLLFKPNTLVICRITSIYKKEGEKAMINVSLRESVVKYNLTLKIKDLVHNNFYECLIMNESDEKFEVNVIGSTFTGYLKKKKIKAGTLNSLTKCYKNKQHVILQLVKVDTNIRPPKLRFSNENVDDQNSFDRKLVINALSKEENEKNFRNVELYENVKMINDKYQQDIMSIELRELEKNVKKVDFEEIIGEEDSEEEGDENMEIDEDEEAEEDIEDDDEDEFITDYNVKQQFLKGIGGKRLSQEIEEEEYEEEDEPIQEVEAVEEEEEPEQHKHKSSKKRTKEHLKEELHIRQKEEKLTHQQDEGESVEKYEKQILSDPNNSIFWIQYAAYILDKLNLSSARKIFERALQTIDIARTKDKYQVWVAYMNLENTYGTQDTFKQIVERALEVNEKKLIYIHLLSIYKQSGKYDLAFEAFKLALKNYFSDFNLWKRYLEFLFEVRGIKENHPGKLPSIIEPKEGLNKATQTLPKSKHIDVRYNINILAIYYLRTTTVPKFTI
jgi:rRNA biogenesis protein RRP5